MATMRNKWRSRAGVNGIGERLGGRTAVGRVELDAEVIVGPAGVVAGKTTAA